MSRHYHPSVYQNATCKTGGLNYDATGNLWLTNPSGRNQLHVIKPDGTWESFSYPGIDNQFTSAVEIIITKNDTKWIIVNNPDLFALRTKNTLNNTGDDLYRKTSVRSRFSNSISSIAINGQNGEVFFATDRGLISWMGDATEGDGSFQHLYAWTNPVRETYQCDITIDGLVGESSAKITDVAGNLVYRINSYGGRTTWNGKNRNGERVSTGVYLIFCADREGNQSRVIKLLFIN